MLIIIRIIYFRHNATHCISPYAIIVCLSVCVCVCMPHLCKSMAVSQAFIFHFK